MGIRIVTGAETFEITDKSNAKVFKKLESLLVPDTPVMIEDESYSTEAWSGGHQTERHLLFVDSGLKDGRGLIPRKGTRTSAYAVCNGKENQFEEYCLVPCSSEAHEVAKLVLPWSGTREHYNEGTFSPRGWLTTSFRSGGTRQLMLGDIVEKKFANALNGIRFVEGGYPFLLDSFYSMPGYLITEAGLSRQESDRKHHEASHLASATAALNLLNQAWFELRDHNHLAATQLGCFQSDAPAYFRKEGYPVVSTDYMVKEIQHPERLAGFIKAGAGAQYGQVFLYPANKMTDVFELAISDDMLRKCYPYGMRPVPAKSEK